LTGVAFTKDVVKAPGELIVLDIFLYDYDGKGRFLGDGIINRWSKTVIKEAESKFNRTVYAVFSLFVPSTLGFMLVGLGVSTIVPTLYSSIAAQPFPLAKHCCF
jgi:hypothetical protein